MKRDGRVWTNEKMTALALRNLFSLMMTQTDKFVQEKNTESKRQRVQDSKRNNGRERTETTKLNNKGGDKEADLTNLHTFPNLYLFLHIVLLYLFITPDLCIYHAMNSK